MAVSKDDAAKLAGIDRARVRAVYDYGDGRVCVVEADPGDTISPGTKHVIDRRGKSTAVQAQDNQPTDGGDGSGVPHVPASVTTAQELMQREQEAREAAAANAGNDAPADTDKPTTGATSRKIEDDGRPENSGGADGGVKPTAPRAAKPKATNA